MSGATPEWLQEYLEIVLNYRELPKFVSARITYRLAPQDMRGPSAPVYAYYVGALYEKYSKGDVENLDKMVFDAFAEMLAARMCLYKTLKMYKQVMLCEENGTATFHLPREPLFALIAQNIRDNAPFFSWHPKPGPDRSPILPDLIADLAEIHDITGQWIIPEDELQSLTNP